MAAQTEDSDPCLLPTSGIVLLSESRYKPKKDSCLMSMANCRRVGRRVIRRGSRSVKALLECI